MHKERDIPMNEIERTATEIGHTATEIGHTFIQRWDMYPR